MRADEDVDREREDDADEARAGDAAAPFQHQEDQDRTADDAFGRQIGELVGQRLVAHRDIGAERERDDGGDPIEPARGEGPAGDGGPHQGRGQAGDQRRRQVTRSVVAEDDVGDDRHRCDDPAPVELRGRPRGVGDEGERQRQPEADRQQLLGVERDVEGLPRDIEHPQHHAGNQQGLQDIGREHGRARRGRRELLCGGNEPFLRRGGDVLRRVGNDALLAHCIGLGFELVVLEIFQRAGMIRDRVLAVDELGREVGERRGHRDQVGLVLQHRVDDLVDHLVLHLAVGEQDVVHAIGLHRLLDADIDRAGPDLDEIAVGEDLAARLEPLRCR